ncbi:MAG: DUF1015 domain-containing protein [Desulfobulbaceae bacterium]
MALIAPFRGLRFNPEKVRNLDEVITPPYDVISEEDGAKFLEKNVYNMIQLDLRNSPHGSEVRDESRYRAAKDLFDTWQEQEVLIRDEAPAIYLYTIDYTHPSGRRMTRKGIISLVGLAEFSEGIVLPHEKTFETVIVDRMRLMDECRAQFSQVFSMYKDRESFVVSTLEQAKEPEPVCIVRDHLHNTHTLWRVTDTKALAAVRAYFKDKPVYIADGHHRYTTALGCRRKALERNPDLPPDSPYNFIMMYLCSTEDEGLSVLPTHRLLEYPEPLDADTVRNMLEKEMNVEEVNGGSRETLMAEILARMNETAMSSMDTIFGLYHPGEDRSFLLRLKKARNDYPALTARPEVLRDLDVVVLDELVFRELLGLEHQRIVREKLVGYYSDPDEALDVAVKKSVTNETKTPLLFLMNPTRVHQVTRVADSGEIMPHKSTYFYPKIVTGLLINKLVEDEKIFLP